MNSIINYTIKTIKKEMVPPLINKEEAIEKWIISVAYKGNRDHFDYTYNFNT